MWEIIVTYVYMYYIIIVALQRFVPSTRTWLDYLLRHRPRTDDLVLLLF